MALGEAGTDTYVCIYTYIHSFLFLKEQIKDIIICVCVCACVCVCVCVSCAHGLGTGDADMVALIDYNLFSN
jgi:hypothetical protein